MLREEIKAGVACIEIQAGGGVPLEQVVAAKVQRLKAHLEAAFAMPSTTHEESRLKRIAIKRAAVAIADSCDVVVSDLYEASTEPTADCWGDMTKAFELAAAMPKIDPSTGLECGALDGANESTLNG